MYAIIGNIDQVNVLKGGTPRNIKRITRETVETGKTGGELILQTADYLEYGTSVDNIKSYVETGLEFGGYKGGYSGSPDNSLLCNQTGRACCPTELMRSRW